MIKLTAFFALVSVSIVLPYLLPFVLLWAWHEVAKISQMNRTLRGIEAQVAEQDRIDRIVKGMRS